MQASIIKDVEMLEKLVLKMKEMNDASLDASNCKENVWDYLESLSKDEFVKILGRLVKEKKEILGYGDQEDLEIEDTFDEGNYSNSKDNERQNEYHGGHGEQAGVGTSCPPNLEGQNPSVNCHGYNYSEVRPNTENRQKERHDWRDQQGTVISQDGSACNRKEDLITPHESSKGQVKQRRKQSWEFPSPNPSDEIQGRDSGDQQHLVDPSLSHAQDDHVSSSSKAERLVESGEELSDSNTSSGGRSRGSSSSFTLASYTPPPAQACADDNRNILHATENDQPPEPSGPQRSSVEGTQNQLADETQHLQKMNLELLKTVDRLSQLVTLSLANGQSHHTGQTSCPNCDELNDQVANLEQHCQQCQEQIAELDQFIKNRESRIRTLTRCCNQFHDQTVALEEVVHAQNEDKKDNQKIIEFLLKKIKRLKEELNMANKRAYEVAQKRKEDLDALQNAIRDTAKIIEKYLAEKEEKETLKRKLQELEEKWKEKRLAEQRPLSVSIGHGQPRTQLRDLQCRLGLCFLDDEEKDLNPQHDDEDGID